MSDLLSWVAALIWCISIQENLSSSGSRIAAWARTPHLWSAHIQQMENSLSWQRGQACRGCAHPGHPQGLLPAYYHLQLRRDLHPRPHHAKACHARCPALRHDCRSAQGACSWLAWLVRSLCGTLIRRCRRWATCSLMLWGRSAGMLSTQPAGMAMLRDSHASNREASADCDGTPKAAHLSSVKKQRPDLVRISDRVSGLPLFGEMSGF